jgi:NitT/TauT family transport system ATP-binding protein
MMDEPLGALDALTREQMRIDIEKLWLRKRQTVLFITHSITEAVLLSDRIIVMTPRPGQIDRIFNIELPRPRHIEVQESEKYAEYCKSITDIFLSSGVLQY